MLSLSLSLSLSVLHHQYLTLTRLIHDPDDGLANVRGA